jgi:hypothetical protein
MAMTAEQHRASKRAGRPFAGRTTKYAGRIIAESPAHAKPLIPSILIPGRATHVCHGGGAALGWCREFAVHLAAGIHFGAVKPPRALRIAVATMHDRTADALTAIVESIGVVPKHRFAIHKLRFDWGELIAPTELARVIRANGSEVLLAECGQGALCEVRKNLGDLSLPILTPCDPLSGDAAAITLRLADDKTFEISEAQNGI